MQLGYMKQSKRLRCWFALLIEVNELKRVSILLSDDIDRSKAYVY